MAGRRSGKTEIAKRKLVLKLADKKPWPDPRYFFAAPTAQQASRIAWNDIKALTPKAWIADVSESQKRLKTIFGSEVWVLGMDAPQRAEGVPWDWGVLDESSDMWPGVFDRTVYPALADRAGGCWEIGVPKRQGVGAPEFKKRFDRAARGEDPDDEAFHWESETVLPRDIIEHAKRTLDEKTYNEQFRARWETATGLIYYAFSREYNVRPCKYDPSRTILVGQDFNVDPMAWIFAHRRGDILEVFDELWMRDANTPSALNETYRRYQNHKAGFEFYGDASGKARRSSATQSDYEHIAADKRFLELGRTIHYNRSNPAQADRYAAVNCKLRSTMGETTLFIDPKCVHLIEDMEYVAYPPDGGRVAQKTGDLTHISDALGYVVHYIWPIRSMIDIDSVGGQFSV